VAQGNGSGGSVPAGADNTKGVRVEGGGMGVGRAGGSWSLGDVIQTKRGRIGMTSRSTTSATQYLHVLSNHHLHVGHSMSGFC
jgi:hypothetical protein